MDHKILAASGHSDLLSLISFLGNEAKMEWNKEELFGTSAASAISNWFSSPETLPPPHQPFSLTHARAHTHTSQMSGNWNFGKIPGCSVGKEKQGAGGKQLQRNCM